MWFALLSFCSAFLVSGLTAPLMGHFARRLGVVDCPDGHRKNHSGAIPLTGGPTIMVSGVVAVGLTLLTFPNLLESTAHDVKFLLGLLVSGSFIVALGVMDDRIGIRGRQKLAGQILAGCIMLPCGVVIREVSILGYVINFGDLAPLITLGAIVAAINALNLIDGVDGLASSTGIVLSLSVAAVTYLTSARPDGLLISLVLAGSLCGFLLYNFPPARMFLGDSGSMLIGLVLGCIALKCSLKEITAATLVMPTAIWAIPMFDVTMAVVRRKLTGRSIYETDRGHLHHCLQRKGVGGAKLLLITGSLCSLTGIGAVASTWMQNELIAIVAVVTAFLLLILTRSFGHTEMSLLSNRMKRLTGSMLQRRAPRKLLHKEEVRLHGDHNWHELWNTLTEFAERFDMEKVELMVNLPNVGEEYHASWRSRTRMQDHEAWRSEIPLIVDGLRVGQIKVVGAVGEGSICKWMSDLIGGLHAFEAELVRLIEELRAEKLSDQPAIPAPKGSPALVATPAVETRLL